MTYVVVAVPGPAGRIVELLIMGCPILFMDWMRSVDGVYKIVL